MRHQQVRSILSVIPPPRPPRPPSVERDAENDIDIDLDVDLDVHIEDSPSSETDGARAGRLAWSGVPAIAQPAPERIADRRRSYRHEVELASELSLDGRRHACTTRLLSLGGAFIESSLRPAFNARIELRFTLPGQGVAIEVGGIVRWSDLRGFGVQFDGLRAHAVWSLGRFFERLP